MSSLRPPDPDAGLDPEWRAVRPVHDTAAILRRLGHDLRNAAGAAECLPTDLLRLALLAECAAEFDETARTTTTAPWIEVVESALEGSRWLCRQRELEIRLRLPDSPLLIQAPPSVVGRGLDLLLLQALASTPAKGRLDVQVLEQREQIGLELDADFDPVAARGMAAATRASPVRPGLEELVLRTAARSLQEAGGRIEVHGGTPDAPLRLALRLPVSPADGDAAPASPALAAGTAPPVEQRILVVDDNRDAARTLALSLYLMGLDTAAVHHGRDALARLSDPSFGVVLLDLGLPEMDGYTVARRIRSELGRHDLLLVAVTGYGDAESRARATEAGFDHHLVKPVDEEQLSELLRERGLLS